MSLPIDTSHSYLFLQQDVNGNIQWASNTISDSSSLTFTTISSWPVQLNKNSATSLDVIILNNLNLTSSSHYFITASDDINIQSDYTNTRNITINIDSVLNYPGFIQNGSITSGSFNNDAQSNITISYLGITISNLSTLDNTTTGFEAGWLGQTYWGNGSTGCLITKCYSTGDVNSYSGGILGSNSVSTITDCFSSGSIGNYAGGIVGSGSNSTISKCYSSGSISDYAGGIVGSNCSGSVSNSYSSGTVSSTGAGGIIGNSSTTTTTNVYIGNGNWSSASAIDGTNLDNTTTPTYSSGNVSEPLGSVWATTVNDDTTPFVLSSFNLNTGYVTTSYSSTYGTDSNSTTPSITNQSGSYSIINYTDINNTDITINSGTGVVSWTGTIDVNTFNIYVYSATTDTPYYDIVLLDLTISQKALTITADAQSNTYGTAFTLSQTALTPLGLVNSDSVSSATIEYNGSSSIDGTLVVGSSYTLDISSASGSGLSNYSITYQTGTLTINTKALTITADAQSNTYGTAFTLDQTAYTSIGLVNSDSIASVLIKYNGSISIDGTLSAGSSYTLDISSASGSGLSNYSITYQTGTLTINTKALTITADAQSNTYGTAFTLDQTAYTSIGLVNSDSIASVLIKYNGSISIDGTLSAGSSYTLDISSASGSGLTNYSITYVNGTLTIDKYNVSTLTVTASQQETTYGITFSISQTAFTVLGLINGDTLTSATITFSGDGETNINSIPGTVSAGTYTDGLSISNVIGSALDNYTIEIYNYVPGDMVINTKSLTITASTQTGTYGDVLSLSQTAYTSSGLINGDSISAITIEYNSSTNVPDNVVVGTYSNVLIPSTAVGTGLDNYTINYVDENLVITPRNLTITASTQSTLFGTTFNLSQTAYTVEGLNSSTSDSVDSVLIKYDGSTIILSTLISGTYILDISNASGSGLENYTITYVEGNLYVNIIVSVGGNPNKKNIRMTYQSLGKLLENFKKILGMCTLTENQFKILDLTLADADSDIQTLLAGCKNIMDVMITRQYSSYTLRLSPNTVLFNILYLYNIGQGIMRNTNLTHIDFSPYYNANSNTTISIKSNSEIYPSPYSTPIFIDKVKTTIDELKHAIQILGGFLN